jgi:hypothetical protein
LLSNDDHGGHVHVDLDTLKTALSVKIDDELKASPQVARRRPVVGIAPKLSDAELLTVAVLQALLGLRDEARWLRSAHHGIGHLFRYLPKQPGYNKRLRAAAAQLKHCIRILAVDTAFWPDDVWIVDSTPVECGRSRETVKRSALAGSAGYGYCRSDTRYFFGLRLHLVCTPAGLPIAFALAHPKADERDVLVDIFDVEPQLLADPPRQLIIADKSDRNAETEAILAARGATLLRPSFRSEPRRPGEHLLMTIRQLIESVNQTLKAQLVLERHGRRTTEGVAVRVLERILTLTATIWHNHHTGQPVMRSLVA